MKIKIGTRGSKLALAQTNYVLNKLKNAFPEHNYEIVIIKTTGDTDLTKPLDQIGSKGLFVDEIEKALLAGEIQLAVHSMKDMPSKPLDGLCFAKSWEREDPRDVLILKNGESLKDLKNGACIATGSKRRSYQLLKLRNDIKIIPIRGNIDTRLRKLMEQPELDGIILAAAGLKRLGITCEHEYYFDIEEMIPSPAQGALAIEISKSNTALLKMINSLSDGDSEVITSLERGFLNKIGGDCHLPVGAFAKKIGDSYELYALFGNEDGTKLASTHIHGTEIEDIINRAVSDINGKLEVL